MNPLYPAAVTCLALLLYAGTTGNCVRMRARHKIAPPATSGHIEFEKAYRVQLNTLEHMAIFLPALWLYAAFVSAPWAAAIGIFWVLARIHYAVGYMQDPAKRLPGFVVAIAAMVWLLVGGIIGIAEDVVVEMS